MLGNLNPLGDGPGRSLADHGARVPEGLPAAVSGFRLGKKITKKGNGQNVAPLRHSEGSSPAA